MKIAIIGGGISGLACAHRLVELSRDSGKPVEIILLEASDRLGGVISTTFQDGCLLEGGPDSFLSEKPWALELCKRVGLEKDLIGTDPTCRRSFVVKGKRLLPVPEGFQLLAPAPLWPFILSPLFSLRGKIRMACDLVLPRKKRDGADESLADFVRRRLGQECLERIAQPMIAGIYAADPELLSLEATMPRFVKMEEKHGSLIRALRHAARVKKSTEAAGEPFPLIPNDAGPRYALFMTLKDGLQTLVETLASQLPERSVRLGTTVSAVDRSPAGEWRVKIEGGGTVTCDRAILAVPARQAARLIEPLDPVLAQELAAIPYGGTTIANVVFRRSDIHHPLDGFGFVVPSVEGRSLIACSFESVKFAGRAPEGLVLLRAFASGNVTLETILKDLAELLGISGKPRLVRVSNHPQSMAHYHVGHLDRVARIESRLAKLPGLALAGNAYSGIGIPDCIHSGEMAAENLLTKLDKQQPRSAQGLSPLPSPIK